MSPPVLAHAGHWLGQLLYLAPVAVLVLAVVVGRLRERRSGGSPPPVEDAD